jgi:hypothetical protein
LKLEHYTFVKAFLESNDHDQDVMTDNTHHVGALKGMTALIGLYVFFLGEKIMQIRRSQVERKVIIN